MSILLQYHHNSHQSTTHFFALLPLSNFIKGMRSESVTIWHESIGIETRTLFGYYHTFKDESYSFWFWYGFWQRVKNGSFMVFLYEGWVLFLFWSSFRAACFFFRFYRIFYLLFNIFYLLFICSFKFYLSKDSSFFDVFLLSA